MNRLVLCGLSLVVLGLATWASQRGAVPETPAANIAVPQAFGPIQPRLSADGQQLAFSYQGAIWRMPRAGGAMTRLTDGAGFDLEPAWSPDGQLIAYVNSPRFGNGNLQIVRADDGQPVLLREPVLVIETVGFSKLEFHPDGRLMGNFRIADKDVGLAFLNLKTGETQPIVKLAKQARYALSRDGKQIVYTSALDRDGQQWGNDGPQVDVWKISSVGGEPAKITRFPSRVHDLCWSADDRELFFVSEQGGAHYDLWRFRIDDPERSARRISFGQGDEERPSVSSNGRWLAYTDNREGCTSLVVRDLSNGVDASVLATGMDFGKPVGAIALKTRDKQTGRPVVSRVSIRHAGGKFFAPTGALYRVLDDFGHFYCDAEAAFTLPAGEYHLRAFHGPEYRATHLDFTITAGQTKSVDVDLDRWTNPTERGWHSGENHIHANYGYGQWYNTPETMLDQCAGEDLQVCNFMVANSDTDGIFDREFFRGKADPVSTPETIIYWNQEFRSTIWGHMTLVNLRQVVEPVMTGFQDTTNPWDIPTNSDVADRTHLQKGLVNYTHSAQNADDPYQGAYTGKGIPVDVALGKIDTLDLNASYAGTIPLWYRLLNCGFRLPPSAGTDCFLNRVRSRLPGADRVYVKLGGEFSYQGWIDGLKAGRSFVSSGPMLELAVDEKGLGETLKIAAPREVHVVAKASSQFPLNKVELVYNGKVVASGPLSPDKLSSQIDAQVNLPRSGWLSLRASGPVHPDHTVGPLEAHTAPIYVEVAGKPTASRDDAEYFLKWIDRLSLELRLRDRIPSPQLRQHVDAQLESARAVYAKIVQSAE